MLSRHNREKGGGIYIRQGDWHLCGTNRQIDGHQARARHQDKKSSFMRLNSEEYNTSHNALKYGMPLAVCNFRSSNRLEHHRKDNQLEPETMTCAGVNRNSNHTTGSLRSRKTSEEWSLHAWQRRGTTTSTWNLFRHQAASPHTHN